MCGVFVEMIESVREAQTVTVRGFTLCCGNVAKLGTPIMYVRPHIVEMPQYGIDSVGGIRGIGVANVH